MPSIADLYSTIDSYKRRAADVLSDPQNSLMQMLGYANDRARNYNESLAQASKERGYGPKTQELAQAMAEAYNPVGMTTWHGSPHTFNKFDLSKIGTGEGAQAYGHGIYVAENPEVARGYANRLGKNLIMVDGKPMDFTDPVHIAASIISDPNNAGLPGERLASAIRYNPKGIVPFDAESKVEEIAKALESGKLPKFTNEKGNFYKVDLPDEHIEKMLDWDKPLSQQPKNVQKAFNSIIKDSSLLDEDTLKGLKSNPDPTGKSFYNQLSMSDKIGHPSEASNILNRLDVPGIKYLDEQSRGAGEGTRNFVIFDPNLAKIEERNSIPIPQDPHAPNYLEDVHNALSSKFEYPKEQAFKIAQENAALPVSEGGLGLPKDNTPEMRAKAMGFDLNEKLYHGTNSEFSAFEKHPKYGAGTYATEDPEIADIYAESERRTGNANPNVLPIVARGRKLTVSDLNPEDSYSGGWFRQNMAKATGMPITRRMEEQLPNYGYDRLQINNMSDLGGVQTQHMFPNPNVLRSKFAAFDPKEMNNPDLLAGLIPLSIGGATLGTSNDDVHSPNYLENLHKKLAQKPIDVTYVHAPNYLEDIHNQLANQQ